MSKTNNYDPMDFSELVPVVISVTGPDKEPYELHEPSGDVGTKYNNIRLQKITAGANNSEGIRGIADLEPMLVAWCLKYGSNHSEEKLRGTSVPLELVKSWPYQVQSKLAKRAIEIGGLDASTQSVLEVFKKALNNPDAPVTLDALVDWINQLDPSDGFEGLQEMFKGYKPKK